jgi:diaminopimelate decarboxylase
MFDFLTKEKKDYSHFPIPHLPPTIPSFTISQSIIQQRLQSINQALNKLRIDGRIAVSFKTNYNFATSYIPQQNNLLAETVSQYEYNLALKSGFARDQIIINGPNKGDITKYNSAIIHLDNFTEISRPLPAKATIGLRLNTKIVSSRFGFNIENGEANQALQLLHRQNISINSIHIHLGSDIYETAPYHQTASMISKFIKQNNLHPKYIDFGGGFPAHGSTPYGRKFQKTPEIIDYIEAISPLFASPQPPVLILEPGRYLIDDATYFATTVINSKSTNSSQEIIVDSTINMLPSLWYRPATITALDKKFQNLDSPLIDTTVYGSSCQEHDVMYRGKLPQLLVGHYLVFFAVGAYNQSQSGNFIFEQPPVYGLELRQ